MVKLDDSIRRKLLSDFVESFHHVAASGGKREAKVAFAEPFYALVDYYYDLTGDKERAHLYLMIYLNQMDIATLTRHGQHFLKFEKLNRSIGKRLSELAVNKEYVDAVQQELME